MTITVEHDLVDASCLSQFKQLVFHQTGGQYVVKKATSLKSAQQRVFIATVAPSSCDNNEDLQLVEHPHSPRGVRVHNRSVAHNTINDDKEHEGSILDAIQQGQGKLVLRIWKGSARWWNLNSNKAESCSVLANAEVAGYKLARHAFEMYHTQSQIATDYPLINIPKVLHFNSETEHDEPPSDSSSNIEHCRNPWAVFSYAKVSDLITVSEGKSWEFCDEFIHKMVKIRKEFGFDEPHPRHGRVCIEDALEYTTHVLDAVVIPIHGAFFSHFLNSPSDAHMEGFHCFRFERFLKEIATLKENSANSGSGDGFMYEDMIRKHQEIILQLEEEANARDTKEGNILNLIRVLNMCIEKLSSEWISCKHLPPVLCHMDLQPQNMILCRNKHQNQSSKVPRISSVLDWEEAFLADPRFEILLLCRKVVANREQADVIWNHYSAALEEFGLQRSNMGSIEPWLKLETVHSLLTMCLQGMNLQGGGRDPWEGNSDLWAKITRELNRLHNDFGWTFCKIN